MELGGRGQELDIIIPAFNEEGRIRETLRAIADHVPDLSLGGRTSIRVIDNGSADRTADVVDGVRAERDDVAITVEGCAHQGKGRAVERGMLTSRARWVGFCDADLATPPQAIGEALGYLRDGWPVVIGSRHLQSSEFAVDQPLGRRLGGAGFRLASRVLAGRLEVADSQCGFKFFQRAAAQDIFRRTVAGGFAFDVDVLSTARHLGYPVKEFAVRWSDRAGSTFDPVRHGPEVTRELWQVRRARQRRLVADEHRRVADEHRRFSFER